MICGFALFSLTFSMIWGNKAYADGSGYFRRVEGSQSVIVFIHGIFGDARSTWTSSNGAYWPDLIAKDELFKDYSIYVYEYPTRFIGAPL
jgi:hypothetical protein